MVQTSNDISSDLPKGTELLKEVSANASNVSNTLENLLSKIENEYINTDGLSLLELKNQMFLSYLANLSYTVLRKLSGVPLEDNSSIENLVELRVVLERIRPLEDKMKYQIQNYIQAASESNSKDEEGPDVKITADNIGDSSDEESLPAEDINKVYKIPKISQTHYPGEDAKPSARQKRDRVRALSSSMLKEALEEHTDDPEVHHNMDILKKKAVEKRKELERYEEENFTRLSLTKKERAALKQINTPGTIGSELLSFRSLEGFDGSGSSSRTGKKRKLGKSKGKKSKGKSFKRKRKN